MSVGLAEDIIFRGVFFNVFKEHFGELRKGLFVSMADTFRIGDDTA